MTPVPDRAKAIEAMARGMLNETRGRLAKWDIPTWEEMSASRQDAYRADARAALAALEELGWGLTSTRESELADDERTRRCECEATHGEFTWRGDPDWYSCMACDGRTRPHSAVERTFTAAEALSSVPVEEED